MGAHKNSIDSIIPSLTITGKMYKGKLKELHTKIVTDTKDAYSFNKAINERAPPVHESEKDLL